MSYRVLKETWVNKNIENYYKHKKFLGLITRCKDEFFIKEFTDYYLSQGVDTIYILDDNSNDKSIYDNITDNRVIIKFKHNIVGPNDITGMAVVNNLYSRIKDDYEWIIFVDADEFITTKKNFDKTIRDELKTTFKDVDYIRIPWVLMSSTLNKNPKSILDSIVHRINQNKKHDNPSGLEKFDCSYNIILCKYIIRTRKFNYLKTHRGMRSVNNPIYVCGVTGKKINIYEDTQGKFSNLREKHIKNGYLLCYHYRIISRENTLNKHNNNYWYNGDEYDVDKIMKVYLPEVKDETLKIKKNKLNF